MSLTKIFVLFAMVLFSSLNSQGAEVVFDNDLDRSLYLLSKHHCEPIKAQSFYKRYFNEFQFQVLESSFQESFDHVSKLVGGKYLPNARLVGLLGELTESQGFMQAMAECFPDENERNRYVASLFIAERLALFVNIYGLYKSVTWIVAKYPRLVPVVKSVITFSMLVVATQIPSASERRELEKLRQNQTQSRIDHLKSQLASSNPAQQVQLRAQIQWLELKKSLDVLESCSINPCRSP